MLSACGVVNACLSAREHVPDTPIDVVLGGYELAGGAMEGRIEATAGNLAEQINPRVVAPGHCTGRRAKAALAVEFTPDLYGPSVVGARYVLKTG